MIHNCDMIAVDLSGRDYPRCVHTHRFTKFFTIPTDIFRPVIYFYAKIQGSQGIFTTTANPGGNSVSKAPFL